MTAAVQSGRNLAAEAQDTAGKVADNAQDTLDGQIENAEEAADEAVSDARTTATSLVQDTSGTLQDTINEVENAVDGVVETAEDALADGQTTVTTLIDNTTDAVQDAIEEAPGTIEQNGPLPGTPFVFASAAGGTAARVWWEPAADAAPVNNALVNARRVADGVVVAQQVVYPSSEGLFQGLQTGAQYYFEASARNAAGASPFGRSNVITAGALPPSAPTNIVAWPKHAAALVEWDPPATLGTGITAYRFHAIDAANDSRSIWRDIPGRHTSIIENVPSPTSPIGPIAISEPRADTPAASTFRFCAMAATDGGYGPQSCSTNLLTTPILGPVEPPPCSVAMTDEDYDQLPPIPEDDGSPRPLTLSDRLNFHETVAGVQGTLGGRFGGTWDDLLVTPSVICLAAVGLTAQDMVSIRRAFPGPVDRIVGVGSRYTRAQLAVFQDQMFEVLGDFATSGGYGTTARPDLGRVVITLATPDATALAALSQRFPAGSFEVEIDPEPYEFRDHQDPAQARNQYPPYRAGLSIQVMDGGGCTSGFTMLGPTGIYSGSTAGHCFSDVPPRGPVYVNGGRIGEEGRNSWREVSSSVAVSDFANIALVDSRPEAVRAEIIVYEQSGYPVTREVECAGTGTDFRRNNEVCVSSRLTRECAKINIESTNRNIYGRDVYELFCARLHTLDGDSGGPTYVISPNRGSSRRAVAAGWVAYGKPSGSESCFAKPETVQRAQGLRVATIP